MLRNGSRVSAQLTFQPTICAATSPALYIPGYPNHNKCLACKHKHRKWNTMEKIVLFNEIDWRPIKGTIKKADARWVVVLPEELERWLFRRRSEITALSREQRLSESLSMMTSSGPRNLWTDT